MLAWLLAGGCIDTGSDDGCSKDTDCRSPRICTAGLCMEPTATQSTGADAAGSANADVVGPKYGCGDVDISCNCSTLPASVGNGTVTKTSNCSSGNHVFLACGMPCGGGGVSWRTECTCDAATPDKTNAADGAGTASNPCAALAPQKWSGATCAPLGNLATLAVNELVTLWHQAPNAICPYPSSNPPMTACGPGKANNAFYCGLDDVVAWDVAFMNQLYGTQGDFASVVVIAHEWGHLNQQRAGLLGTRPQRLNELHADCQAGMFAAVQQGRGNLNSGDAEEALTSVCAAGDPSWRWYDPNSHGSCAERVNAFKWGYTSASSALASVCSPAAFQIMLKICAN